MKKYKTLNSIALLYIKVAELKLKEEFFYEPSAICYQYGYGCDKDKVKKYVREYIKLYGKNNLKLSKNTLLESKLLNY